MPTIEKSPITSFLILDGNTGEVVLQTPLWRYFYRAVYPEQNMLLPHLIYQIQLDTGERLDVTHVHLDHHPRLTLRKEGNERPVYISNKGKGIIDLRDIDKHPDDNWLDYILTNEELMNTSGV